MSSHQPINWRLESGIGFIEFNNPPGNAMTPDFYHQLDNLVTNTLKNTKFKAIIITGTGRHFSSGADLERLFQSIAKDSCLDVQGSDGSNSFSSNLNSFHFFKELKVPVIAAIRGVCIGAAMELAMFCHFRICAQGSVLGLPESGYGLIPGIGGIQNLVALTGQARAIQLVMKGSTFTAEQGFQWKVVDAVVPKKELMEVALKLADISSENYKSYLKKDYLNQLKGLENSGLQEI